MAIRVDRIVNVFATRDTAQSRTLFGQATTSTNQQIMDGFEHGSGGTLSIAASGSENLPFGDVDDVRRVYVKLSGSFNVVFNAGSDTLSFVQTGTDDVILCMDVTVTQVAISNPSATTALTGEYFVWGDPTS